MESPLSPIVADMIMQDLEEIAIGRLLIWLLFYFWWLGDIILAAPSESINNTLKIFNSLHIRSQFTMEIGIILRRLTVD